MLRKGGILVWMAMAMIAACAIVGCRQSQHTSRQDPYESAASFLITHKDSFYNNPAWMCQRLDSIVSSSRDSGAIYLARLYNSFCRYLQTNNCGAALADMARVESYCRGHEENHRLYAAYWNASSLLQDKPDSAIYCLEQASLHAEKAADTNMLLNVAVNLADTYRQYGKLPEAARYWRKALAICDSMSDEEPTAYILIGLAQTYSDMSRYDMADRFMAMADSAAVTKKARYLLNMARGNSYYSRQDYGNALKAFREALLQAQSSGIEIRLLPVYTDLAEIYTLTEQYDSARRYLGMARERMGRSVIPGARYYLYSLSADLAFRQHRDAEAARFLDSLELCGDVSLTYRYQHKRRMMQHYARSGDYRRAYAYRDEMERYDDSIRNMQQQANLAEIDYRYHRDTTLLRQQLLLSESNEKVLYSRVALVVTLVALAAFISVVAIFAMRRRRKAEAAKLAARNRIAQLRMQGVRNRVTPHLVLNALHSARLSATGPVYEQLVDVLRDNLMVGDNIGVPLDDELRIVGNFVELYRMTHADCPTLEISREESASGQVILPAMSIQIPVENALKHAFGHDDTDRRIKLRLYATGQTLHVRVSDNGKGYHHACKCHSCDGTGNGIYILCQTFDVLNQFNSRKIRFEIVSPTEGNHGTRVELDVPQDYNYTIKTSDYL